MTKPTFAAKKVGSNSIISSWWPNQTYSPILFCLGLGGMERTTPANSARNRPENNSRFNWKFTLVLLTFYLTNEFLLTILQAISKFFKQSSQQSLEQSSEQSFKQSSKQSSNSPQKSPPSSPPNSHSTSPVKLLQIIFFSLKQFLLRISTLWRLMFKIVHSTVSSEPRRTNCLQVFWLYDI